MAGTPIALGTFVRPHSLVLNLEEKQHHRWLINPIAKLIAKLNMCGKKHV